MKMTRLYHRRRRHDPVQGLPKPPASACWAWRTSSTVVLQCSLGSPLSMCSAEEGTVWNTKARKSYIESLYSPRNPMRSKPTRNSVNSGYQSRGVPGVVAIGGKRGFENRFLKMHSRKLRGKTCRSDNDRPWRGKLKHDPESRDLLRQIERMPNDPVGP